MIRTTLAAAGLALAAAPALAVGGFDDVTPTPTETTTTCAEGTVWDNGACVPIVESRLEDEPTRLLATARELAYAGRHEDAIDVLERSTTPDDTMVLTYLGFSHRGAGRMDTGLGFYDRALAADPDNLLARAYLGMAYMLLDAPDRAEAQLREIRVRGGMGAWPEVALSRAIANGSPSGYDY